VIDKLDLRLPRFTQFRQEPREFMLESRHFDSSSRTLKSGRYEWVSDLRPVGIDARLQYSLKRDENDPHEGESKLEILDAGTKPFSELAAVIERTIDGPIDDLELMRLDLCADIYEVPVVWFLERTRVMFKRVAYEVGQLKYSRIGKAGIQTIAAGKRPNMVRIYDKIAEYNEQLRRLNRKRRFDAEKATLKSEFGVSDQATMTRVERQFAGRRIPLNIGSFGKLANLPSFNPFTNIEIFNGNAARVPTRNECGFDEWMKGTFLRERQEEMGRQQFCRWLNVESSGNGARYRRKFAAFLESDSDDRLTSDTLFAAYRESVMKQLAA
jgi:hypothetical protein